MRMLETWNCTVRREVNVREAMSGFDRPAETRRAICSSVGVNAAQPDFGRRPMTPDAAADAIATEVGVGAGQVPRRFERHVSPGRQVELGTGSLAGTLGGELHGRTFPSLRLEQRPYRSRIVVRDAHELLSVVISNRRGERCRSLHRRPVRSRTYRSKAVIASLTAASPPHDIPRPTSSGRR